MKGTIGSRYLGKFCCRVVSVENKIGEGRDLRNCDKSNAEGGTMTFRRKEE